MLARIIPAIEAKNYRQIKWVWYAGIDAIEKKDGDFFLTENLLPLIPDWFKIIVNLKEVLLKTELAKLPVIDLKKEDFKVEPIEITPKVITR